MANKKISQLPLNTNLTSSGIFPVVISGVTYHTTLGNANQFFEDNLTGGTGGSNTYISGGTYDSGTTTLSLNDNTGGTINVSGFSISNNTFWETLTSGQTIEVGNYILNSSGGSFTLLLDNTSKGEYEFSDPNFTNSGNPITVGTTADTFTNEFGIQEFGPLIIDSDGVYFKLVCDGSNNYRIVHNIGGFIAMENPNIDLTIIPEATVESYITGVTFGTGAGEIEVSDWLKEEVIANSVTKVTISGRFPSYDVDSGITINFPIGTITTTISANCTINDSNHLVPVNMVINNPNSYSIDRNDTINNSHGVSFQIIGIK